MPAAIEPARTGRVLVVDDDPQIRRTLRRIYELSGWEVDEADSGREALRKLFQHPPDAVLLDLMMDGLDGWQTIERIRDVADVPVLVISGRAAEFDKVRALKSGADDYLTKPFSHGELLARTEAILRRSRPSDREHDTFYEDDALSIDFGRRLVCVGGEEVTLTPLEFRLLSTFVRHPGHVLSWQQLLELAWREGIGTRDQVKVYVGYLRRKLGPAGALVETVRGFGYRYRPPHE